MKSLGGGSDGKGRLVRAGVCTATEARAYSLSQDIAALVVGIDTTKVLEQDQNRNRRPSLLGSNLCLRSVYSSVPLCLCG